MEPNCRIGSFFINSRLKDSITSFACTISSSNNVPSKAMIASTPKLKPVVHKSSKLFKQGQQET